MSIFREIPPTAGFPLSWKDFLPAFSAQGREGRLENDFKHYLDIACTRVANSGTAAFYLILESLKSLSGRKTVVIPSYICPLIPLAIKRAGLRVEVCDINRHNFDYDISMLEDLCRANNDILAILMVHLAGVPADVDSIAPIAEQHSIFTIEDCAQALGAWYRGKRAGTLGDFSFFSLCRGKGLTTYEGGIIATGRDEYRPFIDNTIQRFVKNDSLSEGMFIALLIGYWLFYRPLLFWPVFRLPQIFWNRRGDKIKAAMEDFDIDFPLHKMSAVRQLIGHGQFSRIDAEIEKQRQKAAFYLLRLKKVGGLTVVEELPGSRATYPFVTVIFDSPEKRERALKILSRTDFGASIVYAFAVTDYAYLKNIVADGNCSNARFMAERTLTLSTSTFLTDEDLDAVVSIIEGL
ncbi:MAG: DegT/DnrJ/EryC1/StrS family aminotransferase [Nitrospirae bacterium]|nr:DegT/DnrJ/EryC1/StrS family aminotransferase [Nitrospirota bacterium]